MTMRITPMLLVLATSTVALTGCEVVERLFRTGMAVTALVIGLLFFVGYVLFSKPPRNDQNRVSRI